MPNTFFGNKNIFAKWLNGELAFYYNQKEIY